MRPPLSSEDYRRFVGHYDEANTGLTLAGRCLNRSHAILERTLRVDRRYDRVLEVGAGTGHHFGYVKHAFQRYVMSDGSDEMLAIARRKYPSDRFPELQLENQDASRLDYADGSYDRLIATHVLEHIPDPVKVLTEWNRVVRKGGVISIVLPCDPGALWRIGRHFGPRRAARSAGIEYDYLMAVEHINAIYNLVAVIQHHFKEIDETWDPIRLPWPDLNLFYICHIYA